MPNEEDKIGRQPKHARRSGSGRGETKKEHASPRGKPVKQPPGGYAEEQPGSPAHEEPRMK